MHRDSPIHKGLVLGPGLVSGTVRVWIPTANSISPMGQVEYKHANTGSALHSSALSDAEASVYTCYVATPLHAGAWFKEVPERSASVFNHWYKTGDPVHDYRAYPEYTPARSSGLPSALSYKSDTPALTLAAVSPTLNQSGGTPLPNYGNLPPGNFPEVQANQWVLVAFINSSIYPYVITAINSEEAWETMLG